jgi:hypothetical protein
MYHHNQSNISSENRYTIFQLILKTPSNTDILIQAVLHNTYHKNAISPNYLNEKSNHIPEHCYEKCNESCYEYVVST